MPRLVWLGWLGVVPQSGRLLVGFPVRARSWVIGLLPLQSGCVQEATDRCFFLTLMFLSLSPPLSQNK